MMRPVHLLQCLLFLVMVDETWCHAYLLEPPSRNVLSHRSGQENCPHCLQANGPNQVKARGSGTWPTKDDPSSHGLCGDPVQGSAEPMSITDMKYMDAGQPARKYVAGSIVEFQVGVSTHHWGHYEFRICDKALDKSIASAQAGQECLNTWVLHRAPRSQSCGDDYMGDCQRNNPLHPERWYLPPPLSTTQVAGANWSDSMMRPVASGDEVHRMRFVIPQGLNCVHCTLQWYYATGNNCAYDEDYLNFDPGFKFWNHYKASWANCGNTCCGPTATGHFGEEFWNCADIEVVSDGTSDPNPAPEPDTTAGPTAAPTSVPTAIPTATTTTSALGNSPVARWTTPV